YNISEEECNEIDRFLRGDMHEEEIALFHARIQNDISLAEKVKEMKLMMFAVSETALQNNLNSYHSQLQPSVSPKTFSFRMSWWIAACFIVAIATGIVFYNQSVPARLFAKYYKPDPGLITAMGEGSNYNFERAMVDYKSGAYAKAFASWNQLLKTNPANDTLQYFTGVSAQAASKNEIAINHLSLVAANTESAFYKEACWYLGLAYVKSNEKEKAIYYLEKSGRTEAGKLIDQLQQ
ncbi:MAG TPA: hypothetical protein PL009_14130, partial [Flavipsychrobacter sp.]|nr:hypothetical protein [Flavipsychrobacter sp.]